MAGTFLYVYIGTYTNIHWAPMKPSKGIYIYKLSLSDGSLSPAGTASEAVNPSFLTVDLTLNCLYAANEMADYGGEHSGAASAFAVNPKDGKLTFLNSQATRGGGSCYASTDHSHKYLLVANYNDGNVSVFPILADGSLGSLSGFMQHSGSSVNPDRQKAPYAHSIIMDPSNRFALAADLGMDKIMIYHLDPVSGSLSAHDVPWVNTRPGAGPRHMTFDKNGRYLYATNELDSTVSVFAWDSVKGALKEIQAMPMLPENFSDASTAADIHLTPSGKFLYASNRGHDSLAMYTVDEQSGLLTPMGHVSTHGQIPRNFAIDPTGAFLLVANQFSHNVVVFRINPENGRLFETGHIIEVPQPVCVQIVEFTA